MIQSPRQSHRNRSIMMYLTRPKRIHLEQIDEDLFEMLQEMESQLVAAQNKFSKTVVTEENLSSQDLLNEIHAVTLGNNENSSKEALQVKLQKMNERIRNLSERSIVQKATLRQNDSIMSLESLHDHNEGNQTQDGKSASPTYDNSNMFLSDEQDFLQSVFRSSKSLSDLARHPSLNRNTSHDSTESFNSQKSYG